MPSPGEEEDLRKAEKKGNRCDGSIPRREGAENRAETLTAACGAVEAAAAADDGETAVSLLNDAEDQVSLLAETLASGASM